MLKTAKEKIKKNGLENIELLEKDASNFELDEEVDAILCTWAMVSFPDYKKALENSTRVLKKKGRYVVLNSQSMSGLKGKILNAIYELPFRATHQDVHGSLGGMWRST